MDQRQLQFAPTVLTVQAGTRVLFPNEDDVRHHVYSFSQPNAFDFKLYHGESGQSNRFEHPGVVVLGCNIHDGMLGFLRVVDTPYSGTSNAAGQIDIAKVPPGSYTLQIWHPDLGMRIMQKPVTLGAGLMSVSLKLDIEETSPVAPKPAHRLQALFRN